LCLSVYECSSEHGREVPPLYPLVMPTLNSTAEERVGTA
jgi:hypothetical protein